MYITLGLKTAPARGPLSPRPRCPALFPPALFLALLLLVLTGGCASKQEPGAVRQPVTQSREITAAVKVPPPVERQPVQKAPAPPPAAKPGGGPDSASDAGNVVARMLRSAERKPSPAEQPEAGFFLRIPAIIGDGEAFPVEFRASGAQAVDFQWQGKTLTVSAPNPRTGAFQALLPVTLDEKARALPLVMNVHWADGKRERFTADITLKKRNYPVQKLTVEPKFVTPPREMEEKIKRDRMEMRAAVSAVTGQQYWNLPMLRPVPGEVTSLYGLRRVFNGKPKNPHKGLDLDAKQGDPVHAADDGVVVLVSDHYYGGNTVVVDHGLGVSTAYLHLSGFNVKVGQQVKRGEPVGFTGSTGRVTGPHLHLSLYVMGESVNPLPLLSK